MPGPGFRPLLCGFALALLAGCAGEKAEAPPAISPREVVSMQPGDGSASFFFPLEIPFEEVRKAIEASLPRTLSDDRKQEITAALKDDFYRFSIERGDVEIGFSGEW